MSRNPDLDHWEARFASEEFRFGKEPNEFLVSCKPLLPKRGKALAVADGEGRNGVWLAQQGLEVTSTDFSPSAQAKGRKLATEHNVSVNFVEADAHEWPYPESLTQNAASVSSLLQKHSMLVMAGLVPAIHALAAPP